MPRGRQGAELHGGAGGAPGTLAGAAVQAPRSAHWKAQTAPSETSVRTEGKQTAVSLRCNEAVSCCAAVALGMQGTPGPCTQQFWLGVRSHGAHVQPAAMGGLWLVEGPRSSAHSWFSGGVGTAEAGPG